MTGVVLCGGQSTRMNADKGLLQKNNITWAQHTANKFSDLHLPFIVSLNQQQPHFYASLFNAEKLLVDDKDMTVKGPLLGLLSVHQQLPEEDLFVLACDMQEITKDLLQNLLNAYKQGYDDAYVYITECPQPLCGIYTSKGLAKIYELHQQLKRYSMMHVLELLHTKYMKAGEDLFRCFTNYNSPEDITQP